MYEDNTEWGPSTVSGTNISDYLSASDLYVGDRLEAIDTIYTDGSSITEADYSTIFEALIEQAYLQSGG